MKFLERLELFRKKVEELRSRRLLQSTSDMKFTIKWDRESGLLRAHIDQPDEEDLRSFLLLFRQFISKSEPIFVNRIFNDCLRFLDDERLKEEVRKAKEEWGLQIRFGAIGMIVNTTNLTPEYTLDLWVNGHYFHSDPEKTAELNQLLGEGQLLLVKAQFLLALPALTNIILYMGSVVAHGLEQGLFRITPEQDK